MRSNAGIIYVSGLERKQIHDLLNLDAGRLNVVVVYQRLWSFFFTFTFYFEYLVLLRFRISLELIEFTLIAPVLVLRRNGEDWKWAKDVVDWGGGQGGGREGER